MKRRLIYGNSTTYDSLITPSSTCITPGEVGEISNDLDALWKFYKKLTELYLKSIQQNAPSWIKEFTEHGMLKEEIEAHRLVCFAGLEPVACRIDYVSLGSERKIAEVQWKSGGPGLFFGIQDAYMEAIPFQSNMKPLGDAVDNFYELILKTTHNNGPNVVNAVRDVWLNGENFLKKKYDQRGMHYFPLNRNEIAKNIIKERNNFFVSDQRGILRKISFLNGQGFTRFFPKENLLLLARATTEERLWIETPLNYLYRQKWCLALPFMNGFKDLFEKQLKDIIIPTALIEYDHIDLSPIVPYINHESKEKLLSIKQLENLAELPSSLRDCLIFKCAAGTGEYYSDGKGVFRISGSHKFAKKILDFIQERVIIAKEPWIVQVYIDKKCQIPASLPSCLESQQIIDAHARFMIYGGMLKEKKAVVIGGLGNFGKHWKVSGKSPYKDEHGNLLGTAFNDIRICCAQ
ncbi:MAG: hypothetical protein HY426_00230 [Candidatus Levybacteria bacterium]|nr:hypothetical protein [Candidatus Levybacteria bacterium]